MRAHQQNGADHGGEQHVFLTQRVEAAVIEIDQSHDIGAVPLARADGVEYVAIGPG